MNGQFRSVVSGILALAVAGAWSSNALVAQAADDPPPVITSMLLSPDVANEGDAVRLDVSFSDPGAIVETIAVFWGDGHTDGFTWLGGERSFFFLHTYADDFPSTTPVDALQVTVAIDDLVNPVVRGSRTVTVHNVAPVFTSLTVTPPTIVQGQSTSLRGTFVDPSGGDSYSLEIDWGDSSPHSFTSFARSRTFSLVHGYPIGGRTFTITATLTDDDTGVAVATVPIEVTALNTPPSALAVVPGAASEGGTATLAVSFVDPDTADTHRATVEWGDGSVAQSFDVAAGVTSLSPTHVYGDSGSYNATVVVADGAASTPRVTAVVSVANVAPTVTALVLPTLTIVEGDNVTVDVRFADPGVSDTFVLTLNWGDGGSWSTELAAGSTSVSASHQYLAARPFAVTVTVTDRDNASGELTKTLEVRARNRAPSGLVLSANSPSAGSAATLTGSFTDLDTTDTHTVSVAWGDGATSTVLLGAGAGTFSATHTYATRGTYHVNVRVTDPSSLSTDAALDLVVQQRTGSRECNRLLALERWISEHESSLSPRVRAYLERLLAALNERYHCDGSTGGEDDDDDDDDDEDDDDDDDDDDEDDDDD